MSKVVCDTDSTFINTGTWYQSAVSGLWYQNRNAAGDICAIRVDGVTTYQPEPENNNE